MSFGALLLRLNPARIGRRRNREDSSERREARDAETALLWNAAEIRREREVIAASSFAGDGAAVSSHSAKKERLVDERAGLVARARMARAAVESKCI